MSSLQQGNLGDVLRAALQKLHQEEHFDKYLAYLNSEWYYTADDLRLARNDEKVWGELKFPGRLKIEIATVLDDSVTDQQQESSLPEDENAAQQEDGEATTWVKCWAAEHECYYFYNMVTQESSWEDPQADANVAYDVYQYNDATQEWEVIEDNTSTMNQVVATEPYKNPYSLSDESPMDSPKVSASQKTIFKAESKWSEEKMTAEDAKSSQGTSATDTAAAAATTFTRPRSTPRNDSDDRLFVESPNRPKMLKSLPRSPDRGDEFKRNYKYSICKKNSPARSTPPRKTGDTGGGGGGGQGSGGSQASLLARRAPGGRRVKPVRLNTSEFSSESDSDSQQTSPVAHNVRTHTNTNVKPLDSSAAQKGSTSSRSDDKIMLQHPQQQEQGQARRHSPMMSKPVGRPVGAALSPQRSPKSGVSVSLFDAEAKEGPSGGAQYDWDSKNNETVDSSTEHDVVEVENNNNNNPSSAAGTTAAGAAPAGVAAEEEPYDFYKDYASTDAEYVPPSHFNHQKRYMSAIDIANSRWYENAEEAHLPENYLKGAYIDAPGGTTGDDGGAYYDESQGGGQEGFYDENGDYYTQQQYDESAKTYYDYAAAGEGGEYKDSDYEYPENEYYNNPEGAGAGEEEYEYPAGEYTDEYYGEYDGAYAEGEGGGGAEGAPASSRGIAEEERAYENSYYNHVTTPSAPPADHTAITSATTAPIAAFSPHSQGVTATASQKHASRSYQHQQQQQDSQHSQWSGRSGTSGYSPFNDYKSESPGNRTSPDLSPIATPINSHRHTFVVEATAEEGAGEGEGEGEDLMALAMGSPATPGGTPDQPPAKVKQRSTLSKLFRMNLFKKGPALPSTPPPPRDPSSGALDPHSSAYRHQKMLERKAAKQNAAKNSSTSGGGSGGGGGDTSRSSAAASDTGGDSSVVDHSYRDAILNCDEVTAHSSFGGNIHGERLRRKPAPAPADSTNAVNARQKFYAAHAQTQHYKYHDRIASIERKRASGRGGGGSGGGSYASKQEEIHYRNLQKLLDMGFDEHESIMALSMCGDDLNDASQMLIEERDR